MEAVRLSPFLHSQYSQEFLDNVCLLKIDTEGHDVVILDDLTEDFRPPVIWTEWFRDYQFLDLKEFILEVRHGGRDFHQTQSNCRVIAGFRLLHSSIC